MASVRHPVPAAKRSFGIAFLALLGRLVALAGTVALTMQFGPRGLAAGIVFGFVLPWLVALRPGRALRRDPFRKGASRLAWRPQLRPWAIICGLAGGVGTAIVLQQYSVSAMTSSLLLKGVIGGLLGGLLVPSLTWAFTVRRVNRRTPELAAPPAAAFSALWALVPAMLVLLFPAAALAETSGPCTGSFAGQDLAGHDSLDEDRAILLVPEDHVTFTLTGPTAPSDGEFRLYYGPAWIPIDQRADGTSVSASALVGDYDWVGAGLYRITGEAALQGGQACTGAVLVDIGTDPLDTVLGALGLAMAIAGILGVAGTALHDSADAGTAAQRARGARTVPPESSSPDAGSAAAVSAAASLAGDTPGAEKEPLSTAAALDRAFGSDEPPANPSAFDQAARDAAAAGAAGTAARAADPRRRPGPDDPADLEEWYPRRPGAGDADPFEWPEDPPAAGGRGPGGGGAPRPGEVGQEVLEQLTNPESFEHQAPVAPPDDEDEEEPQGPPPR
jgi:hypothetical protein